MNKAFWGSLLLGAATLSLAGCGESEAPVAANPDAPAGISVSDARMNLPAVTGNPAAVYFTVKNDSDSDKMIRAVNVAGAESAKMHTTATWNNKPDMQELMQLSVPKGDSLVLKSGGDHVMAFDVSPDLKPGGEAEVTVTFVGGDKVSFPARLLAPGDDGGMAGMDHEN